jgi:hypothetical protein
MTVTVMMRNNSTATNNNNGSQERRILSTDSSSSFIVWSGLETEGMREAKCSLLIPEEITHDAKIKTLPKQRVLVYQDKGLRDLQPRIPNDDHTHTTTTTTNATMLESTATPAATSETTADDDHYYVDFPGATIMQLEPVVESQQQQQQQRTMPITLTVGGRCVFTPENYQDFRVVMRNREQSRTMHIPPNGNFEWPDVQALLLCPVCGCSNAIPHAGDQQEHEYWLLFYPLLQITVLKGSQMTLGTRTICRLTCLECVEDLLEGLLLQVTPGEGGVKNTLSHPQPQPSSSLSNHPPSSRLAFTLPAADVLAEAGSASFLEDGPPRPETHPHVDDILDAWTLYNLWEHSGAWDALQNDYRIVLARSMHAQNDMNETTTNSSSNITNITLPRNLPNCMGRPCGNPACRGVHGAIDDVTGEICRLCVKCRDCHSEFYCSKLCRDVAKPSHVPDCADKQRDREERREKKVKKVECDTCARKFPYTKMKKCSSCRKATYCSVDCQRMDWQRHKFHCKR